MKTDIAGMKKTFAGLAATVVATGGLALAGLGLASGTAQADIGPMPVYHWCPGDNWDPGWGNNWDWGVCHDDWNRYENGWGPPPPPPPWQPWQQWGPPPPWQQ